MNPRNLPAALPEKSAVSPTLSGDALALRMEQATHDARGADAPATVKAYGVAIRRFADWCDATGREYALPVLPDTLAQFVDDMAGELAPASVGAYVSAIDRMHRDLGLTCPGASSVVKLAKRRMRRAKGTAQKQAAPMGLAKIAPALDAMGDSLIDLRDAALISLAYDTMCRASELVAFNVADIQAHGDKVSAYIARSKTDQDGAGEFVFVAPDTFARLSAWISAAHLEPESPLFAPLSRSGQSDRLSTRDIGRIFKRRVGATYSAHSTRIGNTVDQLEGGISMLDVMHSGRWKSPAMPARYGRQASAQQTGSAKLARMQGRA